MTPTGDDAVSAIRHVVPNRCLDFSPLHGRDLDDDIVHRLKARSAGHCRSAEAGHREILQHALSARVEPSVAGPAARLRAMSAAGSHMLAETLRHEGRAER